MITHSDLARAATVAREVDLTTFGRETERPSRRTLWITTDALGRIHIRSGQGLARDWLRNLLANPRAVLHINGRTSLSVRAVSPIVRSLGALEAGGVLVGDTAAIEIELEQKYRWQLPAS